MGDTTNVQLYLHACPPEQARAVPEVIKDADLAPNWESWSDHNQHELLLHTVYSTDAGAPDLPDNLARDILEVAPDAAFETWSDPKYDFLGSLIRYTPDLGTFTADCDESGQATYTADQLDRLLAGNEDKSIEEFRTEVAPRLFGSLWSVALTKLMVADDNKQVAIPVPDTDE